MQKPHDDIGNILKAAAFSADKHRGCRRKDAERTPYINHPIAVANLLWHTGDVRDPLVIQAALLHDTIEDTETTHDELVAEFGAPVAGIVQEVTDDKSLPKDERKRLQIEHAPHLSPSARLVKLADKICNLRDVAQSPPADWPLERRREYFDWSKRVVDAIPAPHPPGLVAAFAQAYAARP